MKCSIRIILAIFLLAIVSLPASAAIRCEICKKEIKGKYVTGPENTPYCWDCYTKYQSCTVCGKIYKNLVNVDGHKVCRNCYVKLDKCDICGKGLLGGYVTYPDLGINVCGDCEANAPRCDACGRPAKKLNRIGNIMLCNSCAPKTNRCYSCGNALLDNYKYFEGDQTRKFCSKCVDDYVKCSDCGAPSGPRVGS